MKRLRGLAAALLLAMVAAGCAAAPSGPGTHPRFLAQIGTGARSTRADRCAENIRLILQPGFFRDRSTALTGLALRKKKQREPS